MLRLRNYFIAFAAVFAVSSACALVGMRDAKAQEAPALSDLIKRIEALESKPSGNVTTAARGVKIGMDIRHRFEMRDQMIVDGGAFRLGGITGGDATLRTTRAEPTGRFGSAAGTGGVGRQETTDFTLQWVRVNFDADINRNVHAWVELQDARTFGEEATVASGVGTVGNLQRTDVQEGYVELRNLDNVSPVLRDIELRIGRWRAEYGNHRLIGSLPWANQTRAYDGARLRWDNKKGNWADLFAWQIQEKETGVADGGGRLATADSAGAVEEVLYGLYTHFKVYDGTAFEPYVLVRARSAEDIQSTTGRTGEQRYTVGFRLDGRNIASLPGVDFTVEPAWQFGKVEGLRGASGGALLADYGRGQGNTASETIQASAIYAGFGYTFKNVPWTPRIGYAYSFASGDERPTQGAAKTFDHLYPTGHAHNGYMDLVAWQNIVDHQIHLSANPTKKLALDCKVHFFSMDEEADHLYGVAGGTGWGGGRQVFRNGSDFAVLNGVTRRVDDEFGQEVDFTAKYNFLPNFGVVAGYSHFFAGDWVQDTGGGNDRGIDWAYLMTSVKF